MGVHAFPAFPLVAVDERGEDQGGQDHRLEKDKNRPAHGRDCMRTNGPSQFAADPPLDDRVDCYYSNYMKTMEIKIARIGNSRGIRLSADTLKRYRFGETLILEEHSDGLRLRPAGPFEEKLDWEATALAIAAAAEDWSAWDEADADGLEQVPWESKGPRRIREKASGNGKTRGSKAVVLKRYEIRWAHLDPVQGAEMAKSRPVVIVSLDALNARLQTVTVCPLTTQLHPSWRSRLPVTCGRQAAEIAADQIRTISRRRLGIKIGSLTDFEAAALRRLLTEMFGE